MKKHYRDNDIKNLESGKEKEAYTGGWPSDLREADALAEKKALKNKKEKAKKAAEKARAIREEGYLARRKKAREDNDPTHGSTEVYEELLDELGELSEEYIAFGNKELPTTDQLENEIKREIKNRGRRRIFFTIIGVLAVIAAVAAFVAVVWLPVFRIYGNSMSSTLDGGQIVLAMKGSQFENGDVIAFNYGNKVLVKRVIAGPGQKVNIDGNGNVFVDNKPLSEPYVTGKSLGDCNISLPYKVPEGRYFVMGDNRGTSLDSRNSSVGCIADEHIIGKVTFRVWPLNKFGGVTGGGS